MIVQGRTSLNNATRGAGGASGSNGGAGEAIRGEAGAEKV